MKSAPLPAPVESAALQLAFLPRPALQAPALAQEQALPQAQLPQQFAVAIPVPVEALQLPEPLPARQRTAAVLQLLRASHKRASCALQHLRFYARCQNPS